MTNWTTLPHETLAAYQVACELLVVVKNAAIADLKLRDQALGSLSLLAEKLPKRWPRSTSLGSVAIAAQIALASAPPSAVGSTRS
jgi:hypothetical protein